MNKSIEEFLSYCKRKGRSPLTIRDYKMYCKSFISFVGDIDPKNITLEMVDNFEKSLHEKNLSTSTISYYLIFVRNFLKFLTRQGHKVLNYQLIELPKVNHKILPALNEKEIRVLISSCDPKTSEGLRARTIILFFITSGARVAEVAGLKLTDLEIDEHRATIMGKGGKMRVIFFDNETAFFLKKYLETRRVESPYVFTHRSRNHKDKPLTTRSIERLVKKYGKLSGISKPVYCHCLRRTFATRLLRKGVNIKQLAMLMGHNSIETTSRYIFIEQDELKKVHQLAHLKATKSVKEKEEVIIGRESLWKMNGRINKIMETQNKIFRTVKGKEEINNPVVLIKTPTVN